MLSWPWQVGDNTDINLNLARLQSTISFYEHSSHCIYLCIPQVALPTIEMGNIIRFGNFLFNNKCCRCFDDHFDSYPLAVWGATMLPSISIYREVAPLQLSLSMPQGGPTAALIFSLLQDGTTAALTIFTAARWPLTLRKCMCRLLCEVDYESMPSSSIFRYSL